jgi:acyl carrier protein
MEDFLIDKIEEISFTRVEKEESLWESRVLDSITIVELAVEIEGEFGIKVPFEEIIEENFETIDLIIKYIEKKQNG